MEPNVTSHWSFFFLTQAEALCLLYISLSVNRVLLLWMQILALDTSPNTPSLFCVSMHGLNDMFSLFFDRLGPNVLLSSTVNS